MHSSRPADKCISKKTGKIFLFFAVTYAFLSALYANSHFTVEDAAIHSEIANVLKNNFYPQTYAPVADVQFTYPPLLHYIALFFTLFGLSALDAVKLAGAISFAFFPLAMYFLGSLFGKKSGLFSAFSVLLTPNLFMALIFSEYPEILSFFLFAMFAYFYFRKRYVFSGTFLGLAALAHPFTAFFAAIYALVLLALRRDSGTLKTISIGFLISLFWLPKYIDILFHFSGATWNNARWYLANGFIPIESIIGIVMRLNPFLLALSIAGVIAILKNQKEKKAEKIFFLLLYIIPLFFIIYHYSPSQYKFLDIFSIPLAVFSGIGANYLLGKSCNAKSSRFAALHSKLFRACLEKSSRFARSFLRFGVLKSLPRQWHDFQPLLKSLPHQRHDFIAKHNLYCNKKYRLSVLALILIISVASLPFPLLKIQEFQGKYSAISPEGIEAAEWLGKYDSKPARILLTLNSSIAYKESLIFESELVFSQIAGKIPLDGTISDLEAYTPEYKKQLEDREKMIAGDVALIKEYGVKYVISGREKCPFETIYEKNGVEICRVQ